MPISFNSIPINLLVPGSYIEFDNSRAVQGLPVMPSRIIVFGQKLAAGTAAADTPVLVTRPEQAVTLFGRGSMLAQMFAALKKANPLTETWAIPQSDNAAAVAATGTITIGGAPTTAGTLTVYITGTAVQVAVATTDTPATVATALQAAIADQPDLPVTATVNAAVVTLTANHKGLCGNDINVRTLYYPGDALPAGLTVAIGAMTGGTANPVLTASIAALGDDWYTSWAVPYTDAVSLAALDAELTRRWGPMVMAEGIAFSAANGSVGTLTTLGTTPNEQLLSIMGASGAPTAPWVWAAVYAAQAEYYGNIDAARPLQTLPLTGVLPPAKVDQFIFDERNLLLGDGIATWKVDAGGNVLIERAVTTYRLNAEGLPDTSYLDVETIRTLMYLRWSLRTRIAQKYPRYKLADDGTPFGAGQAIVTPKVIRNEIIAWFSELETVGLVEDLDQFKEDLDVERDGSDPNRVNALIPPNLVNQFRTFAGQIQFIL